VSNKALVLVLTKDGTNPGNVTVHEKVVAELLKSGF